MDVSNRLGRTLSASEQKSIDMAGKEVERGFNRTVFRCIVNKDLEREDSRAYSVSFVFDVRDKDLIAFGHEPLDTEQKDINRRSVKGIV